MKRVFMLATVAVLTANVGHAGRKEADICAAGLKYDSRKIYDRVIPKIVLGNKSANRAMITSTIRTMKAHEELGGGSVKRKVKAAKACISELSS